MSLSLFLFTFFSRYMSNNEIAWGKIWKNTGKRTIIWITKSETCVQDPYLSDGCLSTTDLWLESSLWSFLEVVEEIRVKVKCRSGSRWSKIKSFWYSLPPRRWWRKWSFLYHCWHHWDLIDFSCLSEVCTSSSSSLLWFKISSISL